MQNAVLAHSSLNEALGQAQLPCQFFLVGFSWLFQYVDLKDNNL